MVLVVLTEDSEGSEDDIGGEIRGRHQGIHLVHRVHHQGLSNTVPKLNTVHKSISIFQCCGSESIGSASGSISQKYGSGSGSFHHQAKIARPWFLMFCNFFMTFFIFEEWCKCTSVQNHQHLDPDPWDPYVFGPPGSASGSVSQR